MKYEKTLIDMTSELCASDTMYSLILLKAASLSLTVCDVRCWLDGTYLLCLSIDDTLTVHGGHYEATNLRFLPYFYNINLNHTVIGMPIYNEMRERFGYPDFRLFRMRDENYCGILSLTAEEYELTRAHFLRVRYHMDHHEAGSRWSCHARSDVISIMRIAESAYEGEQTGEENELLRYIRDNLGQDLSLAHLCNRFHTNRTTLTKTIKDLRGMSPMQYVLEERLNQSRPDLLFTNVPIAEVAEQYGFTDVNYYIRAFRKRFGRTPNQYRAEGTAERIRNQEKYRVKEPPKTPKKDPKA